MRLSIIHRLLMLFRFDYASQYASAQKDLTKWVSEGKLKRKFHLVQGLDNASEALGLLFNGGNTGKLYVNPYDSLKYLGNITDMYYRVVQVAPVDNAKL